MSEEKRNDLKGGQLTEQGRRPVKPQGDRRESFYEMLGQHMTLGGVILVFFFYLIPAVDYGERTVGLVKVLAAYLPALFGMILLGIAMVAAVLFMYMKRDIRRYIIAVAVFSTSTMYSLLILRAGLPNANSILAFIILIKVIVLVHSGYCLMKTWLLARAPGATLRQAYQMEKKRRTELLKIRDGERVRSTVGKVRKIVGFKILKSGLLLRCYHYANEALLVGLILFYVQGLVVSGVSTGVLLFMVIFAAFAVLRKTYGFVLTILGLVTFRICVLMFLSFGTENIFTIMDRMLLTGLSVAGILVLLRVRVLDKSER